MAFFNADEYAWKLFLSLNRQASSTDAGVPDPKHRTINDYEDDKPVVWETWALASGGRSGPFRRTIPNRSELYLDKGAKPLDWGKWDRSDGKAKHLEPFQAEDPSSMGPLALSKSQRTQKLNAVEAYTAFVMFSDVSVTGFEQIGEEVRSNRCTYQFIVDNGLYNVEGIESIVRKALNPRCPNPDAITFPNGAQEVKAKWIRISEADKPRYHWRALKVDGEIQIWGLVGMHITTKDLPNWFWASFEHIDTEKYAELPSRDSTTRGPNAAKRDGDREGVRIETAGRKWQYYRLRGTQIDFATGRRPTILANTQIEHGFQQSSSCMTCHSRAVAGLRRNRPDLPACQPNTLPVFLSSMEDPQLDNEGAIRFGPIGAPDPAWFRVDGARTRYIQTDFLWSIPFRANSQFEIPPRTPDEPPQCPVPPNAPVEPPSCPKPNE